MQNKLNRLYQDEVIPRLEPFFSSIVPANQVVRLSELCVNLGDIDARDLSHHFVNTCVKRIQESLNSAILSGSTSISGNAVSSMEETLLNAFIYFLKTGSLAWNFRSEWKDTFESSVIGALKKEAPVVKSKLVNVFQNNRKAIKRLIWQFSEPLHKEILKSIGISDGVEVFEEWADFFKSANVDKNWNEDVILLQKERFWEAAILCAVKLQAAPSSFPLDVLVTYLAIQLESGQKKEFNRIRGRLYNSKKTFVKGVDQENCLRIIDRLFGDLEMHVVELKKEQTFKKSISKESERVDDSEISEKVAGTSGKAILGNIQAHLEDAADFSENVKAIPFSSEQLGVKEKERLFKESLPTAEDQSVEGELPGKDSPQEVQPSLTSDEVIAEGLEKPEFDRTDENIQPDFLEKQNGAKAQIENTETLETTKTKAVDPTSEEGEGQGWLQEKSENIYGEKQLEHPVETDSQDDHKNLSQTESPPGSKPESASEPGRTDEPEKGIKPGEEEKTEETLMRDRIKTESVATDQPISKVADTPKTSDIEEEKRDREKKFEDDFHSQTDLLKQQFQKDNPTADTKKTSDLVRPDMIPDRVGEAGVSKVTLDLNTSSSPGEEEKINPELDQEPEASNKESEKAIPTQETEQPEQELDLGRDLSNGEKGKERPPANESKKLVTDQKTKNDLPGIPSPPDRPWDEKDKNEATQIDKKSSNVEDKATTSQDHPELKKHLSRIQKLRDQINQFNRKLDLMASDESESQSNPDDLSGKRESARSLAPTADAIMKGTDDGFHEDQLESSNENTTQPDVSRTDAAHTESKIPKTTMQKAKKLSEPELKDAPSGPEMESGNTSSPKYRAEQKEELELKEVLAISPESEKREQEANTSKNSASAKELEETSGEKEITEKQNRPVEEKEITPLESDKVTKTLKIEETRGSDKSKLPDQQEAFPETVETFSFEEEDNTEEQSTSEKLEDQTNQLLNNYKNRFKQQSVQDRFKAFYDQTKQQENQHPSEIDGEEYLLVDQMTGEYCIENAGLVLIAPFFKRFFENLGYTKNGAFTSEEIKIRAIVLTQYLVGFGESFAEYEMPLNKVLCGFGIEAPLPKDIHPTGHERLEAEKLLDSAVELFSALKASSPEGLQYAFIKRKGKLRFDEETNAWTLRVEQKTIDLLLDKLPFGWSYSVIKMPWMENMLRVIWGK